MPSIKLQFVRPDRLMYEGEVDYVVLITPHGELGIFPGHAPLICALGNGVVRFKSLQENEADIMRVVVSGGYAEVDHDSVIVLADHARLIDDIEPEIVQETLDTAVAARDELAEDDLRRAYYENKIEWCNLLLQQANANQTQQVH